MRPLTNRQAVTQFVAWFAIITQALCGCAGLAKSGPGYTSLPPEEGAMVVVAIDNIEWTDDIAFALDKHRLLDAVACQLVWAGLDAKEWSATCRTPIKVRLGLLRSVRVFAFVGVAPGRYRVASLSAEYVIEPPDWLAKPVPNPGRSVVFEYELPASEVPELVLDVTATQVVFAGTVHMATKHFESDVDRKMAVHPGSQDGTRLNVDKADEARIVERLCETYKKSPWASSLQARAKELAEVTAP